jgi:hypothetical protein
MSRDPWEYDHFFVTLQAVGDGLGLGIGPRQLLRSTPLPAGS